MNGTTMTPKQAAKYLGVNDNQLQLLTQEYLTLHKHNGKCFYLIGAVDAIRNNVSQLLAAI